jgi:hypothetical protein
MDNDKLEKLIERRKQLDARIRREQNRQSAKQRKIDTRRKILAGAWVLDEAEKRPDFKKFVYQRLDRFLTRKTDREVFGLPIREESETDAGSLPAPVIKDDAAPLKADNT